MQEHYSTVGGDEQRQGIGKVIDLMTYKTSKGGADQDGTEGRDSAISEHHSVPENGVENEPVEVPSGAPAVSSGAPTKTAGV